MEKAGADHDGLALSPPSLSEVDEGIYFDEEGDTENASKEDELESLLDSDAAISATNKNSVTQDGEVDTSKPQVTPLPLRKLIILCAVIASGTFSYTMLFAIVGFMV